MNRRYLLLALLTAPLLGLFFAAHSAASWRPQTLTKQEFIAQRAPVPAPVDWQQPDSLTPAQRVLARRLQAKNWQPLALSPDGKEMLAQNRKTEDFALVRAGDARQIHPLELPPERSGGEWIGGQFSPDGRYVEFACFETTPPQLFDARTGKWLWGADYWGAKFAFSPDGVFAAHTNGQEDAILVRETATGREVKRVSYLNTETPLGFSRDGDFLVVRVAPRQFQRWRLR